MTARTRWAVGAAATFSVAFAVSALVSLRGRRQPVVAAAEGLPATRAADPKPPRPAPVRLAPAVEQPSAEARTAPAAPPPSARPFTYERLDRLRPGEKLDPGPPLPKQPALAGAPSSGTTVPTTMSDEQIRAVQLERLVGLREEAAAPPSTGDAKDVEARSEARQSLAALEAWAVTAGVRPDELADARERLARRREASAAATPDPHAAARP
jgi:hypothetical protein